MGVLSACVSMHHVWAWYQRRPEEGAGLMVVSHPVGTRN